ncbi:hypothetical protein ACN20G_35350 (plasmid) [Streptomyces sp. BI20]|uniref:hypothetical protein n=1 Tax=Streptomyces sp. BI20 TaxID=3403460 RepID=UPI003C708646
MAGLVGLAATAVLVTSGNEAPIAPQIVADEGPGYAEETYAYPAADKVLAEQKIVLKRGDGHIVLADCAGESGLLEVWARSKSKICFKVTGNSGWLTMEIPAVYGIRGSATQTAQVDMTVGSEEKSYDVAKEAFTPVGESADEQGRDHMLVEIRTTR